jgi:translation initiation factor 3 subunit C
LFGDDDDSEESDESDEDDDGRPKLMGRAKWLKKPEKAGKEKKLESKKPKVAKKARLERPDQDAARRALTWQLEQNMTEEELDKKVNDLVASRGRKNTDPREVLRKLEVLSKASRIYGARKEIPVLMHLISAMFDSQRVIDDYMDLQQWRTCYRSLLRVTNILNENPSLVLGVMASEDVTDVILASQVKKLPKKDGEEEEEVPKEKDDKTGPIRIVGSLESFIIRLEDEYTKSLQQINPHTQVRATIQRNPPHRASLSSFISPSFERHRRYPFA